MDLSATGELRTRGGLPQLAELAQERRYLAQTLAKAPEGAARAREELTQRLYKTMQRRQQVAARAASLREMGVSNPLSEAAVDGCERELADIRARMAELQSTPQRLCAEDQERADFLASHTEAIARFRELAVVLDQVATLTVDAMEVDLPAHLPARPESVLERPAWRNLALVIESYRTRWGIESTSDALGPRPANQVQRTEWDAATRLLTVDGLTAGPRPAHTLPEDLGVATGPIDVNLDLGRYDRGAPRADRNAGVGAGVI